MFVRNPISRFLSIYFNKALAFNVSGIQDFGPEVKRRGGEVIKKYDNILQSLFESKFVKLVS